MECNTRGEVNPQHIDPIISHRFVRKNAAFYQISSWHLGLIECLWWQEKLDVFAQSGFKKMFFSSDLSVQYMIYLSALRSPKSCTSSAHSLRLCERTMLQCSELRGEECDNRMELREKLLHLRPRGMHQKMGWSRAFVHSGLAMTNSGRPML